MLLSSAKKYPDPSTPTPTPSKRSRRGKTVERMIVHLCLASEWLPLLPPFPPLQTVAGMKCKTHQFVSQAWTIYNAWHSIAWDWPIHSFFFMCGVIHLFSHSFIHFDWFQSLKRLIKPKKSAFFLFCFVFLSRMKNVSLCNDWRVLGQPAEPSKCSYVSKILTRRFSQTL